MYNFRNDFFIFVYQNPNIKLSNFYCINNSHHQLSFNHVLLYHCQEINCVQCTLTFYFSHTQGIRKKKGVWTKHPRNTTWCPESLHVSGCQMHLRGATWWFKRAIILETTSGMMQHCVELRLIA